MFPRKSMMVAMIITIGFTADSRLHAQPIPFAVALSGTPAPGGGNFGAFSTDSLNSFLPVINDNRRVYFFSTITGSPSMAGLFAGTPGALQAVARQGSPAPSGGNYSDSFSDLRQNNTGQVAFSFSFPGFTTQGLVAGLPGALQTVALTGNPAPAGGNYGIGFSSPLFNAAGQVAFSADLTGGTSTRGLFFGLPGALQSVALQGAPAPGGGTYTTQFRPTINATGRVAFSAEMTGGTSQTGIFTGIPGAIQAVALQGTPAPGGGLYSFVGFPVINNAGQVAYSSALTGGTSNSGIFIGVPGSVQAIALQGNSAPAGGNYSSFALPVLNGAGQVAFSANLIGGSATSGIFVGAPGALQTAALQGTVAPGGGNFSVFDFPPQLNGLGQVAFAASLTGPGVNGTNDRGVYAGLPGALVKVIREGDLIDVDPGVGVDLRTVSAFGLRGAGNGFPSGGEDGRGIDFTDNGLVSYTLAFTNGTSGDFYSSLIAIPEPSSIVLMSMLGLILILVYCRRNKVNQRTSEIEVLTSQENCQLQPCSSSSSID